MGESQNRIVWNMVFHSRGNADWGPLKRCSSVRATKKLTKFNKFFRSELWKLPKAWDNVYSRKMADSFRQHIVGYSILYTREVIQNQMKCPDFYLYLSTGLFHKWFKKTSNKNFFNEIVINNRKLGPRKRWHRYVDHKS